MKQRVYASLTLLLLLLNLSLVAQVQRSADITADELRAHVKYLASEKLEGRLTGSPGGKLAAEYIAGEFKSFGLAPMGTDGYYQPFEFISGVKLGPANTLAASFKDGRNASWDIDKSFRPVGFSASGSFKGGVIFVGYGITVPTKNYDDYAGIDVKDKAVILMSFAPPLDSTRAALGMVSSLRYKASKAREHGAKAILVVAGPADRDVDDLPKLSYDQAGTDADLLVINVTREAADGILSAKGTTVASLKDKINSSSMPFSFPLDGVTLSATASVELVKGTGMNVIGMLEGQDAALKSEVIIIGAHHDHLGWGGQGSGSTRQDTIAIHPGADDNASGTAGLLELAQYFAAHRDRLKRSLLFTSFTGEELGLLGSAHYVKSPTVPLERTVTMINMDMIGRLNNRKLIVYGVGTAPGFDSLVRAHDKDSLFVLKTIKDGFGPSDQSSFYSKKIPVFHFFTDLHSDYHSPADTYDRLNYPGMQQVVQFVAGIAEDLDRRQTTPTYLVAEAPPPTPNVGRSSGVWVGGVPDFGEQVEGVKISGVREGSPAAKGGLTGGDIIIKFGKMEIKNLYDYTNAIGEYKVGDVVPVVVKRGDQTLTFQLTLQRRPN
jgi:aminopeptidase YwaD